MVRFQAAKVWGIWGMSQEPAAFLLDLSSQLLRPTGWSLGFGPAPFSCAWSVPVMSVLRDAELVRLERGRCGGRRGQRGRREAAAGLRVAR